MNQPARPSSTSFSSIEPLTSTSFDAAAAAAAEAALGANAGAAETAGAGGGVLGLGAAFDFGAAADDDDDDDADPAAASGLTFNSPLATGVATAGAGDAAGCGDCPARAIHTPNPIRIDAAIVPMPVQIAAVTTVCFFRAFACSAAAGRIASSCAAEIGGMPSSIPIDPEPLPGPALENSGIDERDEPGAPPPP